VIDAGDPSNLLARLEAAVDLPALRADQREGREAGGPLMGIGLATTIDATGGGPFADADDGRLGSWDSAVIRVNPDGSVTVLCGTHAHGQSHQTTYAQVVADRLGCAIDMIEVVEGDTDRTAAGLGTFASRSMMIAGGALAASSAEIVAKATKLAAHLMGCAVDDVAFEDGLFVRARSNRTLDWADVADAAHGNADRPAGMAPGLEATSYYAPRDYAYPMAATLCVVEVDPQTGSVRLRDYVTADDHGVLINPMIVEGQIHGGAAQGIGQALLETVAFDRTSGQLLSGTFMDYALPRADDLPPDATIRDPAIVKAMKEKIGAGSDDGSSAKLSASAISFAAAVSALGSRRARARGPGCPRTHWSKCWRGSTRIYGLSSSWTKSAMRS